MSNSEVQPKNPHGESPKKRSHRFHYLLLLLGIGAAIAATVFIYRHAQGGSSRAVEDGNYSEEQAAERLRTLEEALKTEAAEVVPVQFFQEEFRSDNGTIALTAITTMPEDQIEEVSFLASLDADPTKEVWYEAEDGGNGYYYLTCSIADLGNREGTYTIRAFITPVGGSEAEAGETHIRVLLQDYLYTEAIGSGVQRLVLVNPQIPDAVLEEDAGGNDSKAKDATEIESVRFKVWADNGEQDDITVYTAEEIEEGIWSSEVALAEFEEEGDFIANAYIVVGNTEIGVASSDFALLPDPIVVPQGSGHAQREGTQVYVEVPEILQNPELPTGCESVALTIVLNSLGYALEKTEIAAEYLPRGTNFATHYVGDPFSQSGAGCFPPAIVQTANKYLMEQKDSRRAHDLTGTSLEELCAYLDNGIPVLVWTSMYMQEPQFTGQVITHRGRTYEWYRSEHCVVLYGYDEERDLYLISDPLVGYVEREQSAFARIYDVVGDYAVAIW